MTDSELSQFFKTHRPLKTLHLICYQKKRGKVTYAVVLRDSDGDDTKVCMSTDIIYVTNKYRRMLGIVGYFSIMEFQ